MLVRIKYWLLEKLVKDICRKSDCDNCQLCMELPWPSPCRKGAILNQARRVYSDKDYEFCGIGLVWPADYNLISFYRFFELVHECNLEVADMRYLKGNETNMNNFIVNGSSKDIAEFRSKLPRVCKDFEII